MNINERNKMRNQTRDSPDGGALGIVLGPRRDWYCRADRAG